MHLKELIRELNSIKGNARLLILSNGSGVVNSEICEALFELDIVKFSLDSAVQKTFARIDRLGVKINVKDLVAAMTEFRRKFKGELVLEILVVKGLNDTATEFKALNEAINQILPNRVDISTIDRPPAYPVKGVSGEILIELASNIKNIPYLIASAKYTNEKINLSKDEIIMLLLRRPQSQIDVDMSFSDASKHNLNELLKENKICITKVSGLAFFKLK